MKASDTKNTNKRSAIITFQAAYNYGAVLQAYALQEYINMHFGGATVLDYHNTELDKTYAKPSAYDLIHRPKQSIFRLIQSCLFKQKNEKIDAFRRNYIKLTMKYDLTTIQEANKEADVFITGSDQVWNYLIIGKDTSYFLDFVEEEKTTCSYAASIGVTHLPKQYHDMYKNALQHVRHISVREIEGIQTLSDLGISGVEVMPDPTLLLEREHWSTLSIRPEKNGKYILVYKITKADELISFSKQLSKKTGLPIIYIPNDLKSGIVGSLKLNIGPREWLGYIEGAEYVVTNSFHGTVFSILFGKKFFSEVSGKVNPSTSRLLTLLSLFGFENRIIDRFTDKMIEKEIDIEKVDRICLMQKERVHAFFEKVYKEV